MAEGRYLNGHVGISREAIERIHGCWGVGEKNEEGEMVTAFAIAFDLVGCTRKAGRERDIHRRANKEAQN